MINFSEKEQFVIHQATALLKNAAPETPARWGKMNLMQTVEHLTDFFDVSSGKLSFPLVTPEDQLPKFKAFLRSDIPFRENTKAPANVVSETPAPARSARYEDAVLQLQQSVRDFELQFKNHPETETVHPVFGALHYEDWILLHAKHLQHHLKQFGLAD
ncbi:MAG: DUF1569 domain-containing protein [Ferruginibacter sp.]|nr:DUF1569 domain-containing protein [Ferruginibacter sp.]